MLTASTHEGQEDCINKTSRRGPSRLVTFTLTLTTSSFFLLHLLLVVEFGQLVDSSQKVTQTGDILLGGIFPVHQKGKGTKYRCGLINKDRGIQRLEAMLFAIDKINSDTRLLPDVKLGAIILDTCSSDSYALNQSLEFIRASINTVEASAFQCTDGSTPRPKYGMKIISGVVGGSYSEVSLQVANLLRLFRIPQVSYASTGTSLSDKTRYDFFARTVPPDTFQALALVDVVQSFNWSYVSIVSSEGQYGDSGMKAFIHEARARNICIAVNEKVPHSASSEQFDLIFGHLLTKPNAKAVVLFVRMEDARGILKAAQRAENVNYFTWVASDGWGKEEKLVEGVEEVAEGAITVELQTTRINGFDDYFKSLNPWNNRRNPWFKEYWEQLFSCKLPASSSSASPLISSQPASSPASSSSPSFTYFDSHFVSEEPSLTSSLLSSSPSPSLLTSSRVSQVSKYLQRGSPNTASGRPRRPGESRDASMTGIGGVFGGDGSEDEDEERRKIIHSQLPVCSNNFRIDESIGYHQETKVQFVVDAVYAFAEALHAAWYDLCRGKTRVCKELKEMDGGEFYKKYLLKVNFTDIVGSQVRFDSQGDGLGRYNIYNFQRNKVLSIDSTLPANTNLTFTPSAPTSFSSSSSSSSSSLSSTSSKKDDARFSYELVGRWFDDGLTLDRSKILFNERSVEAPESVCSHQCKLGEIKVVQQGDHCCWICNPCRDQEFVVDEFTCKKCLDGWWPHENKSGCYQLPERYMDWKSIYAIVPIATSVVGILMTSFVIHIFIKYMETPIVKASGRELSFILLGGILFCFLITFVLLAKPSIITCSLQRFGVGTGFSVIYGALLTKTNRISRIFDSARKSARRPSFISPKSQVVICMIFVSIQVVGTGVWFIVEPPATRHFFPDENHKSMVILKCKVKDASFLVSLVYNIILITTCTVYAIKTRKIPENFNESKFIGFTMYTTCIIWLAFIPLFFGTGNNFEIQITTLCVSISLSAYVALFCLFSPKIYIIVFHPDKNVRKLTMNSATYKRALTSSTLAAAATNQDAIKLVVTGTGIAAAAAATSGGILQEVSTKGRGIELLQPESTTSGSGKRRSTPSGEQDKDYEDEEEEDEDESGISEGKSQVKKPSSLVLKSSHIQDQQKRRKTSSSSSTEAKTSTKRVSIVEQPTSISSTKKDEVEDDDHQGDEDLKDVEDEESYV